MDKTLILNEIKTYLKLETDKEFADFLGIKPQNLSNWKKRNTYDVELLYTKCEGLNAEWLLTGNGEMLKDKSNSHLEKENWIINDSAIYESDKHSYESLLRIGLRLDEICSKENMNYDELAYKLNVDKILLMEYIAGIKAVPISFINNISFHFPHISRGWLYLGYGNYESESNSYTESEKSSYKDKINNLQERIINLMEENRRLIEANFAFQKDVQDRATG